MIKNLSGSRGQAGPEFYCDICGRLIPDLASGRAVLMDMGGEGTQISEVKHVHSGPCLSRAEGSAHGGWVYLDSHLRWLCRNYGLNEVAPPNEDAIDIVL